MPNTVFAQQRLANRTRRHRLTAWALSGLAAATLSGVLPGSVLSSSALAQDSQEANAATAPAVLGAQTLANLDKLALEGDFSDLAAQLNDTAIANAEANSLKSDLKRFADNEVKRAQDRKDALEEAMGKLKEAMDADKLEEALVQAIDAHSQQDASDFLETDPVAKLAAKARKQAQASAKEGAWLKAASLYRLLNLLFEVDNRFSDELKQTNEHLRVLQMYAPVRFRALTDARLDELRGDDAEEDAKQPPKIDPEKWQDRLVDIDRSVLERTFSDCVQAHIDRPKYKQLLEGSIDQLKVLLTTPEAVESFPKFADANARKRFVERLDAIDEELRAMPGNDLTLRQLRARIDLIDATNKVTVQLPDQVLYYELTEGGTDTIDAFTYVIWPADHQEFLERTLHGKIYGVGVQIGMEDYKLTVVTPLINTPAYKAGLKAGDTIETVNGFATSAWSLKRAVNEITGEKGTEVTLGIRREGVEGILEKTMVRAEIPIESVRGWELDDQGQWDYWIDPDSHIAYVRLTQFVEKTTGDLDKAIAAMQAQHDIDGLVLDLRFNPGGLLQSAVEVVDRFVDSGPIVGQVDANNRHIRGSLFEAQKDNTLPDFPMVVLVNQGSASASEIVSGALQDLHRATIIGDRSYGKGSVQQVGWYPTRYAPKWGIRVTTSHYTLPTGRIIHRTEDATEWGIEPGLRVPMTERQIAKAVEYRRDADVLRDKGEDMLSPEALLDDGMDAQLEAALLVLKTQILTDHLERAQLDNQQASRPSPRK